MPRNGSGIYSKPAGTTAVANTKVESAKYNATVDDLVADANAARPVTAGGTGGSTPATARAALGIDSVTPPGTGVYLVRTSATVLTLVPTNGGLLWIDGQNQPVPSSLTLASAGLSAGTSYFVYAYMDGTDMKLEAVATGYAAAANGMPQKSGDATRTLVGRIYTNEVSQFLPQGFGVLSYFNRKTIHRTSTGSQTGSSGGTSFSEANTSARTDFMTWPDEDAIVSITGVGFNNVNGSAFFSAIGIDGSVTSVPLEQVFAVNGSKANISQTLPVTASEGIHYATIMIKSDGVGTAFYVGLSSSVAVRG